MSEEKNIKKIIQSKSEPKNPLDEPLKIVIKMNEEPNIKKKANSK